MAIKLVTDRLNRLNILPVSFSDLDKIHELHSLPETDKFFTLGIPDTLYQTEKIIQDWIEKNDNGQGRDFTFKVELIQNSSLIGLISLNLGKPTFKIAKVWYKFHFAYWNKGYATESLKRVIEFAFDDLNLNRIEAGCAVENIGSLRTLEKAGMTYEGRKRKILPLKDGWSDTFEYAILSTDLR